PSSWCRGRALALSRGSAGAAPPAFWLGAHPGAFGQSGGRERRVRPGHAGVEPAGQHAQRRQPTGLRRTRHLVGPGRDPGRRRELSMPKGLIDAQPEPIAVDLARTAIVVIDMQRDFLEPGGFGETLGNDVSLLKRAIEPIRRLLARAREQGVFIVHTREGHRPDLSDAPRAKVERGAPELRIGAQGPMGRILVRGEPGHDIIPELYPKA